MILDKYKDQIKLSLHYLLDRLAERSTWEGVGFLVGLTGSRFGQGLDWGLAAGIGGTISAMIKAFFPDTKLDQK
jgi:hypothetical protein